MIKIKFRPKEERILTIPFPKQGFIVRFNEKCMPDPARFDVVIGKLKGMGYNWHSHVSQKDQNKKYKPIATGIGLRDWSEGFSLVWSDETTWEEYGFITLSYDEFFNNNFKIVKGDESTLPEEGF